MSEKKREYRFFTIMEYEEEQEYLRERHRQGWGFVRVSGLGTYNFEKCEPEDVVYQLDYNQDGRDHKEEYLQMFRDCGWEYINDYFGYSYFRKAAAEMDGEESIFCDDESRLDMMKRIFRGRMLPVLILLCAVIIPGIVREIAVYDAARWPAIIFLSAVIVLWGGIFIRYAVKYNEYKKRRG